MTILASDLITQAARIYQDVGYDRVSESDWISYLNAAIKRLIGLRPDAHYKVTVMQLSTGALQSLPAEALRLIDITRNMGSDGATPGSPVTQVDKDTLDRTLSWYTETAEDEIEHYSYDPRKPRNFTVEPPSTNYIELSYSYLPTLVTASDDTLDMDPTFEDDLLNWMLYQAYLMDADEENNWARAQFYYKAFFTGIGIEGKEGDTSTGER